MHHIKALFRRFRYSDFLIERNFSANLGSAKVKQG